MNARQTAAVEYIKNGLIRKQNEYASNPNHYEYKSFEVKHDVTEFIDIVFVTATVGMSKDGDTMASIMCRDTFMFQIGKCGGLKRICKMSFGNVDRRETRGLMMFI